MISDVTPGERAALLTHILGEGRSISTEEAAALTGVSVRTSQRDFITLERVLPVARDYAGKIILIRFIPNDKD